VDNSQAGKKSPSPSWKSALIALGLVCAILLVLYFVLVLVVIWPAKDF